MASPSNTTAAVQRWNAQLGQDKRTSRHPRPRKCVVATMALDPLLNNFGVDARLMAKYSKRRRQLRLNRCRAPPHSQLTVQLRHPDVFPLRCSARQEPIMYRPKCLYKNEDAKLPTPRLTRCHRCQRFPKRRSIDQGREMHTKSARGHGNRSALTATPGLPTA